MPLIEWRDSYGVGVDLIDADHKLLVSLINQLYEAHEDGQGTEMVGSALNVLIEYTETHFSREELLLEKGAYPELAEHREEHRRLTQKVRDITERYNAGDTAVCDDALIVFLKDWLTDHILGVDMKYKSYVQGLTLTPAELLGSFHLDEE
ncbi:MAG: hypothetical protein A2516_09390 [Alphaproteobacteria bacterium RIFOXYD12_FULL_60_8]|nr:MAG: hypothetical protein A2516_09390 [Alphaproteobacteria bacterium RIFOXYD12_FULL_60_8]